MTDTHTELPFHLSEGGTCIEAQGQLVAIARNWDKPGLCRANAAFIVRACNSHADLLEACKAAVDLQTANLAYANYQEDEVTRILDKWSARIHAADVPFSPNAPASKSDLHRFVIKIRKAAIAKATEEPE